MIMKLPISWPITETYQFSSFVMSIILSHDNTKNLYENNYINLFCLDTDQLWHMDLEFWDVTWEDFRKYGIFEMDLFSINNFSSGALASFLRERIDQGNYLLLHMVDEFYLPYSEFYQNDHFVHDTYIYGYENEFFWVMAYSQKKLKQIKVSAMDIEQSLFSAKDYKPEVFFCSLRPNQAIHVNVDYHRIKQSFYEYLGYKKDFPQCNMQKNSNTNMLTLVPSAPKHKDNYVYGNQIYTVLNNCIDAMLINHDFTHSPIDIRPFRLLWEHKRILQNRINYIITQYNMPKDILYSFEDVIAQANTLFMLAIKYDVTNQKKILESIISQVNLLREHETELLTFFLDKWELI